MKKMEGLGNWHTADEALSIFWCMIDCKNQSSEHKSRTKIFFIKSGWSLTDYLITDLNSSLSCVRYCQQRYRWQLPLNVVDSQSSYCGTTPRPTRRNVNSLIPLNLSPKNHSANCEKVSTVALGQKKFKRKKGRSRYNSWRQVAPAVAYVMPCHCIWICRCRFFDYVAAARRSSY